MENTENTKVSLNYFIFLPLDNGEIKIKLERAEPALSPNNMTWLGSPPVF